MKALDCDQSSAETPSRYLPTLELLVNRYADERPHSREAPSTILGRLAGFSAAGLPLVEYPDHNSSPIVARTTVPLSSSQLGSEVVLCFAGGDQQEPIILGCLLPPTLAKQDATQPTHVELDGQRLELTAQEEIVFRCGKSSITLTAAGKVLIRGEYLLSRSAGVNRIKGGSVQIN